MSARLLKFKCLTIATILFCGVTVSVNVLPAEAESSAKTGLIDSPSTFLIEGNQSLRGPYHGGISIDLRKGSALRIIEFDNFRFENMKVREVWSGKAESLEDKGIKLTFELKQAENFTRVDQFVRQRKQFQQRHIVKMTIAPECAHGVPTVLSFGTPVGAYAEKMRPPAGENLDTRVYPKLEWSDQRNVIPAPGLKMRFVADLGMATIFYPLMTILNKNEFYRSYSKNPEFISKMQYCIIDSTDFEFLRAHPDTISVDNKLTDEISLVESRMRTTAYGPKLLEKCAKYQNELLDFHLNQYGLFSGALFDDSGKFIQYLPNGDGCLWSGMFAGSEAMRWLVSKDKSALDNFKRTTRGLMLLMDVTGDEREFARTAQPYSAGQPVSEPWARGQRDFDQVSYVKGGNNDMIKGLFHAFAWAYEILPPGDPFLSEVSAHVKRLPQLKISQELNHPANGFCSKGLAAIASGKIEDMLSALAVYELILQPVGFLRLDEGLYAGGMGDWSGVNLMMVSSVSQILIAKHLYEKFLPFAPWAVPALAECLAHQRQKLMETWATYAHVRRDFMTIAADTFAARENAFVHFPQNTMPKHWEFQRDWESLRQLSIWSLRELPLDPGKHYLEYDYSWDPAWSLSYWPHLPWKSLCEEKPIEFYYMSAYNYPLFEVASFNSDNVWTSAFDYRGAANPSFRNGRIDFLHVYWMGRLSGLVDEES